MPNWDRYCTICGQDGSYLDFNPPYGDANTQHCPRHPEDGCGSTVRWLDEDDPPRIGRTKPMRATGIGHRASKAAYREAETPRLRPR